jgi:8-oxo-dGTP pyrophosphatase MutT (NUDIX family)
MSSMAIDGEEFEDANQSWIASWYPPSESSIEGKRHGSGAVCRTSEGQIVLIRRDGMKWEHPAGRPEGEEAWRQTLDREVMEEACAIVVEAKLLGFIQGRCLRGHEEGLVLVRALWSARVALQDWERQYEVQHRKLVGEDDVDEAIDYPWGMAPIYNRWLAESQLV